MGAPRLFILISHRGLYFCFLEETSTATTRSKHFHNKKNSNDYSMFNYHNNGELYAVEVCRKNWPCDVQSVLQRSNRSWRDKHPISVVHG